MSAPADVARELELLNKDELVDRATAMALALNEAIAFAVAGTRPSHPVVARWREARTIT